LATGSEKGKFVELRACQQAADTVDLMVETPTLAVGLQSGSTADTLLD
jgi:hypothetical protein